MCVLYKIRGKWRGEYRHFCRTQMIQEKGQKRNRTLTHYGDANIVSASDITSNFCTQMITEGDQCSVLG